MFTTAQQHELLRLARESIGRTLREHARPDFPEVVLDAALLERRSAFVTLRIGTSLRGCCGSIDAARPLAHDVWHNAWASAFCDPRFPPLSAEEWPAAHIHISVLSTAERLNVLDEQDLYSQLRPHVDGLILERGASRATFLPSVWEQLPEPRDFVEQLKRKAGWAFDVWPADVRVFRYRADGFGEDGS